MGEARRAWGRRPVVAMGAALVALFALPAAAHAATATSVVLYSDAGDYIGAGQQRLFTPSNSSITVTGNSGDLHVSVSGGANGDQFSMEFAAPPGQTLAPGVYTDAERAPFRTAGHPGIDIDGDSRGCNETAGRFEVKDFAADAAGTVQRLWLVFEQHCEGGTAALFGEVRIGVPVPDAPAATAPAIVRWPPVDPGGAGTAVPVTLAAASGIHVTGVSVTGANPGDFVTRLDDCSGKSLGAGGSCEVWMRFVPTAAGTRTATLDIADNGGHHYTAALQGFSYGGTTKAVMHSDQGDYIGQGLDYAYTPANATIAAVGSRQRVTFGINGSDGSYWTAEFHPASGDILAPGTYDNATRAAFSGTGAGMDVYGNGRGCNEVKGRFTVTEATYDAGGRLRTLGIKFEQHCEGQTPAFHGELDYRVGDTTAPAPWMTNGGGGDAGGGSPGTGAGQPVNGPQSGGGAGPTVTLAATRPDIAFGTATRLSGTVTSGGKPVAGAPVELQAGPFPFAAFVPAGATTTDSNGRFSFRVNPDRNTRFEAVSAGGTSPQRSVFVELAGKVRRVALGGGRYRETVKLIGPPDLPYAGRRLFFYKLSHGDRRARRAAYARLLGLGHGRMRASAVLRLRGPRAHTLECMHEATPDAWGLPLAIDRACGARLMVAAHGKTRATTRPIPPAAWVSSAALGPLGR